MKLEEISKAELRDLEATIGQLLMDGIEDVKLSELQKRILDILEEGSEE